jgi:hypothetical protein
VQNQAKISDDDLDAADAYLRKKQQKAMGPARRRDNGNGARDARKALIEAKGLNPERVAGLEWEAWHQRTLGKPVYKIAQAMGATIPQVHIWLQDAMKQVMAKTQELIELDKELELQRTETLMERYMRIALMDEVLIQRIRAGEPVTEWDLDVPRNCAYLVIELIKLRCKIKGITMSPGQESMLPVVDVMGWLQTQKEFITKTVKDAPRDVLTLEVETNIDETSENSGSTEGIQGAI